MKETDRARPCRTSSLLAVAALLMGVAACGGSSGGEEQERATGEALAATDAQSGADTAQAPADTADTVGTWMRSDTAATSDTAAAGSAATGATGAPGGEATYETYRNEKFGYSVRYPSNAMQPGEEVGNGNGRAFEAPDGSASMFVYATGEATPENLQRRFEEQTTNPDLDMTYQTKGDDWYVLSGYRGDHIFYERAEARGDALKVMRMFYDRSKKDYYDAIVREMSFSLDG
jgi:hypothetical protein